MRGRGDRDSAPRAQGTGEAVKRPRPSDTATGRGRSDARPSPGRSRTAIRSEDAKAIRKLDTEDVQRRGPRGRTQASVLGRIAKPTIERHGRNLASRRKDAGGGRHEHHAGRRGVDQLQPVLNSSVGRRLQLDRQYRMHKHGDIARRLDLHERLRQTGGWRSRRTNGRICQAFTHLHFGFRYPGPSIYPRHCWTPHWRPWVDWCWWDVCYAECDPRPLICRPIVYNASPQWTTREYPVWRPLPVVASGTWVDVPAVDVPASSLDLQLLAVRFVDPGHPQEKLGPRYRIWFRNSSAADIVGGFNVVLLASNGPPQGTGYVEAGVRVTKIQAAEIQSVDIRLPFEATTMGRDEQGTPVPFSHIQAVVDGDNEVNEVFPENNGAVLSRGDVLSVDPALFSAEKTSLQPGETVAIAGEGLGPEPGKVMVFVAGLEMQAEIHGWFDLGVRVKMPPLLVTQETKMEVVVVRGDGAASNSLPVQLVPHTAPSIPSP